MGGTDFHILLQLLAGGLIVGGIYGLIALGFVIIYKSTTVVNFAQGDVMMVGAYFCYYLIAGYKIPFIPAFVITLLFSAALGVLVEFLMLRPMVGEPVFSVIMITVGLSTLLRSIVGLVWGHDHIPFPTPFSDQTLDLGGLMVTPAEITTFVAAVGLFILFGLFFKYTKLGLATRATAFDQRYAFLMGISVRRIFSLAWILASVVASIGGVFLAGLGGLDPNMSLIGLKVFPAVVLGGLDSIAGAVLGGLVIGVAENLAGGYLSPWLGSGIKELSGFFVLLVVLMFKPYGLFGKAEIIRV
ncbi:MAG: branched-chain amino acid ABC transporter permease [Thermodesulfobacteriota bacterium]